MTVTEEVNKTSLKNNSLFELEGFLSGLLFEETIVQETIGYVFSNRGSIENQGNHNLHYIADQKVAPGVNTVKEILPVTKDNRGGSHSL